MSQPAKKQIHSYHCQRVLSPGMCQLQVPCEASLLALVGGMDVDRLPSASRNIMIVINMIPALAFGNCRCLVKHLC